MNGLSFRKQLLAAAAALVLASAAPVSPATVDAAAQQAHKQQKNEQQPWVQQVTYNGYERGLNYPLLIEPGRIWIGLYDADSLMSDYRRDFDEKSGKIAFTNPWRRIELKVGSKTATINGNKAALSAAPKKQNGTVYLPVQLLTQLMKAEVGWNAKKSVLTINYESRVLLEAWGDATFWVDKLYGNIYKAAKGQRAVLIDRTTKDLRLAKELDVEASYGGDKYVLRVMDRYAEPTQITRLIINGSHLVHQASVHYPGWWWMESLEQYGDYLVMIDGTNVELVNKEGMVSATYNLAACGVNGAFVVEDIYDDMLFVRSYSSRTLILVDLREKKSYELYKQLLDADEQQFVDNAIAYNNGYPGDKLTVIGRKGDTFTLRHDALLEPYELTELTFTIAREQ